MLGGPPNYMTVILGPHFDIVGDFQLLPIGMQ